MEPGLALSLDAAHVKCALPGLIGRAIHVDLQQASLLRTRELRKVNMFVSITNVLGWVLHYKQAPVQADFSTEV